MSPTIRPIDAPVRTKLQAFAEECPEVVTALRKAIDAIACAGSANCSECDKIDDDIRDLLKRMQP